MKKIKKRVLVLLLLLNMSLVSAITQQEATEAKNLIDSKMSCDKLANEQLEIIGEYYMEQMHPGESHESMHKMMGIEEGSDAEKQFHINMARTLYCNEGGMMGMMGGMPMMGPGGQTPMMQGMMGNRGYGAGYWGVVNVLYVILLIGLILLVYLWIVKLWKSMNGKK